MMKKIKLFLSVSILLIASLVNAQVTVYRTYEDFQNMTPTIASYTLWERLN